MMSVDYKIRPNFGIRFSIPMSIFIFIGFLLITPLLLFIFLILINIGINPLIAFTVTVISLITSSMNIMIAEVTYYTTPFPDFIKLFPIFIQRIDKLFIELNIGGSLIPILISIYLILRYLVINYYVIFMFIISLVLASFVIWRYSRIIPNVGVALPSALPVILTLVFTLIATAIFRANPLAFSYSLGALSTLLGADVMNLRKVIRYMRGYVSIGGAGVFDGIYLTSLLSLILASIYKVLL